jgi:hypothetical protein
MVRAADEFSPQRGENSISPNCDILATADVLFESISQLIRDSLLTTRMTDTGSTSRRWSFHASPIRAIAMRVERV